MKVVAVLIAIHLLMTGCAHPEPYASDAWKQRATFKADSYECERDARELSRNFMTGYQGIYTRCMEGKGYNR